MAEETKVAAPQFKRKRAITLPTFKFDVDVPLFVKILAPMHVGKVRLARGQTEPDPDKKPPTLATCVNLQTGELGQVIMAEVLKTELQEAYPNESYVGKGFEIVKQKRKDGKRYDPYSVAEIEVPAEYASMTLDAEPAVAAAVAGSSQTSAPAKTAARR